MQSTAIRIGTRGSPLALAQAEETRRRLVSAHALAPDGATVVPIRTTRRPHHRPAAGRGRRQGPVHQGDRRGAARRPDRPRRAFGQGHADGSCRRGWSSPPACREPMCAMPSSRSRRSGSSDLPQRRGRRYLVAPAKGAGASPQARPEGDRPSRQRRDAPPQDRGRRGGGDVSRARRARPARPRRPRQLADRPGALAAGGRPGDHRHRGAHRRRRDSARGSRQSTIAPPRSRLPPSAPSSPSSTVPAGRRSAGSRRSAATSVSGASSSSRTAARRTRWRGAAPSARPSGSAPMPPASFCSAAAPASSRPDRLAPARHPA